MLSRLILSSAHTKHIDYQVVISYLNDIFIKETVLKLGYTGNGTICTNIDECSTLPGEERPRHTCATNGECTDTDGTYTCACLPGFIGNGFTCEGH